MRRRRKSHEVPDHLATFAEADWPGRSWEDRFALWQQARRVYAEAQPWPGGPLAMLRDESDTRRRHRGQRLLAWDRTPEELAELNRTGRRGHHR